MTLLPAGVLRVAHRTSLTILAAAALLSGCGTTDASDPLIPGPAGRVRFVNLITDAARVPVNAILESVPFGVNIAYGGTTPSSLPSPANAVYSPILTGSRTLVLKRTADTTVTVATFPFPVGNNGDYTIYATGGAAASAVTAFITTDTNSAPAVGRVRVRVVHLAPGAGNVDVFVTPVGADLALATPTLANVALRASAYLDVAAGTYQVRAVPAGTAPASRAANTSINLASAALPANGARTIIAADNATGGAPFRFIVLADR
ncbi:MAG: DUF4397 domain-containing protein [Gemmatimonadota bacterium]